MNAGTEDRQKIIDAMDAFTEEYGRHGCSIAKLQADTGIEEAKLRRLVMRLSGLGWLIIHPSTVDPDQIVDVVLCRNE